MEFIIHDIPTGKNACGLSHFAPSIPGWTIHGTGLTGITLNHAISVTEQ